MVDVCQDWTADDRGGFEELIGEPYDLANASGSDKGPSGHPSPHHYTRIYDMLLQPHRHNLTNMLEIGLMAGGQRWAAMLIESSVPRPRSTCG